MTIQPYYNFNASLDKASDSLAKMQAEFRTKYQYTIMGKEDFIFADVAGPALTGDDNFAAIKTYRTSELVAQSRIEASADSADSKLKQKAAASLNFVNQSAGKLVTILEAAKSGDKSSTEFATAIGTLAKHLQDAVADYAAAVTNGTVDATKDTGFAGVAKSARFALLQLSLKLKPLLIGDNQIFNTDMYDLNNKLNDIQANLNIINAGGASSSAAATSSSSTGSTIDVTV